MADVKWPIFVKPYVRDKAEFTRTKSHPLQGVVQFEEENEEEESVVDSTATPQRSRQSSLLNDPLSAGPLDPLSSDPLSMQEVQPVIPPPEQVRYTSRGRGKKVEEVVDEWLPRRAPILAKFTTSQKLTLGGGNNKGRGGGSQGLPEKVRDRLEQLDEMDEGPTISDLTQAEYTKKIEEMGRGLYSAWNNEQRVKALKLCIQLSKLLIDTSAPQFYPSKFVLITDILIKFGSLVFERLKEKSATHQGAIKIPLPAHFTPDDVPDLAKETASNWFFKVASIRELLPRLYLQLSILKSNLFISKNKHREVLAHCTAAARGVGDPLVSNYLRCFTCRIGLLVEPGYRNHLLPLFNDAMTIYPQIQMQTLLCKQQDITMAAYSITHTPTYDWLLHCLVKESSDSDMDLLLTQCADLRDKGILLNALLTSLPECYVCQHVLEIMAYISSCKEKAFPTSYLLKNLGLKLRESDMSEKERRQLLRQVWQHLSELDRDGASPQYIDCALVWVQFICRKPAGGELNNVLDDIIKHLLPSRSFENCYPTMEKLLSAVLSSYLPFSELFGMSKFLPFLDLFQKEAVKVEACKSVLRAFQSAGTATTKDSIVISGLMYICKALHNSVNALTLEDQRRDISALLNYFIMSVDHGRDFSEQLEFYVECRASFSNLDPVLCYLVQSVDKLAVTTLNIVKGNHNKKTSGFIRACMAYCYITIPSIMSPFTRLDLYLSSGQIALLNSSLVQCDLFFKQSIALIPEVPLTLPGTDGRTYSTEPRMLDWLARFLSSLVYVPDSPSQQPLAIFRELFVSIEQYKWSNSGLLEVRLLLLRYLVAVAQPSFTFNIETVNSNDKLYGQNKKYLSQIDLLLDEVLKKVMEYIQAMDNLAQTEHHIEHVLKLIEFVLRGLDVTQPQPNALLTRLITLCVKEVPASVKEICSAGHKVPGIRGAQLTQVLLKIERDNCVY